MAVVKITKKDRFNQLLAIEAVAANEELVEFINHELELLDKKSSKKKSAKENETNQALMNKIKAILTGSDGMTITEILMAGIQRGDFETTTSNQKIRTLVGFLMDNKVVNRRQEGRKVLFSLA